MNVQDIRPSCKADCSVDTAGYRALRQGVVTAEMAQQLLPDRQTLGIVWRYLAGIPEGYLEESPVCLCRKIVRWSGQPLALGKLLTCLDIFSDVKLLETQRQNRQIIIRLLPQEGKSDLNESQTMQRLNAVKES